MAPDGLGGDGFLLGVRLVDGLRAAGEEFRGEVRFDDFGVRCGVLLDSGERFPFF